MIASLPGSSNSRGMRTAWLRPFLNSLTRRSAGVATDPVIGAALSSSPRALVSGCSNPDGPRLERLRLLFVRFARRSAMWHSAFDSICLSICPKVSGIKSGGRHRLVDLVQRKGLGSALCFR
jgi:hypothetical protein